MVLLDLWTVLSALGQLLLPDDWNQQPAVVAINNHGVRPVAIPRTAVLENSQPPTQTKHLDFLSIQELITLRNGFKGYQNNEVVLAIGQYGRVAALKLVGNRFEIISERNISLPISVGYRGGIWHAAIDEKIDRIYVTLVERLLRGSAVYFIDGLVRTLLDLAGGPMKLNLEMKLFVKPSSPANYRFFGLAFDDKHRLLFVTESALHDHNKYRGRIAVYRADSPAERRLVPISIVDSANGTKLQKPWSCAVRDEFLAVTEHSDHTIPLFRWRMVDAETVRFDYLQTIAKKGSDLGEVLEPWGLNFDANDDLLIADRGNKRFQKFRRQDGSSNHFEAIWESPQSAQHPKTVTTLKARDDGQVHIVGALFPAKIVAFQEQNAA